MAALLILWIAYIAREDRFPLLWKIPVSIVISCCWWCDDVATILAIMAAFFLSAYLHDDLRLGADYYMGVPIVEPMCLVMLRFLVSNYWNVWISFSAHIIPLLLHVAHIIQRNGVQYVVKNRSIEFVILAAPPILLLISFLLDDTT